MNQLDPALPPPARKGRRRSGLSRGDLREIALLDAAEELLRRKPAAEITIDAIASATGLSRSSVYFYFDNKNSLVDAVVERASGSLLDRVEAAVPASGDSHRFAITRLVSVVFDVWRREGHVFRVAVEQSYRDAAGRAFLDSVMGRYVQLAGAAVEEDRRRGVAVGCPPADVRPRVAALSWMGERNCYRLFSRDHGPEEEEELLSTLILLFRRGLEYPG